MGVALQIAPSTVLNNAGDYNRLDDGTIWTIVFHTKDDCRPASVFIADMYTGIELSDF
jgi:hypothetical protein